jgi:hypothetical protein
MFIPVMAYSLLGHSGGHHGQSKLVTPADLWSLIGSSWAMAHGHLSHIYVHGGSVTSPPALEIVMVPFVLVAQAAGLASHYDHGQPLGMWLLFGPLVLLLASPLLFAVDAIARHWHLEDRTRLGLALASALGVANVAGLWGHPEDCIAVAMVLWSALAIERHGTAGGVRAAWLLGVGIAFQPLAILAVAPVLTRVGWRSAMKLSWRVALPSVLVLIPPLIGEPAYTRFVLIKQPFVSHYVSFTPLTHLAPTIAPGVSGGGPTRLVATVLSVCLAIAVCRRRHDLATVLTMTAVAFFLRVLFETELNWYYLWPVAAVCLLLSARRSRLGICTAALFGTMVLGNHNTVHHIVIWWPMLMILLAIMMACAVGTRRANTSSQMISEPIRGMAEGDHDPVGLALTSGK